LKAWYADQATVAYLHDFIVCLSSASKKRKVETIGDGAHIPASMVGEDDYSPAEASNSEAKEEELQALSINKKGFMRLPGE
jgi:hypothetical protein